MHGYVYPRRFALNSAPLSLLGRTCQCRPLATTPAPRETGDEREVEQVRSRSHLCVCNPFSCSFTAPSTLPYLSSSGQMSKFFCQFCSSSEPKVCMPLLPSLHRLIHLRIVKNLCATFASVWLISTLKTKSNVNALQRYPLKRVLTVHSARVPRVLLHTFPDAGIE